MFRHVPALLVAGWLGSGPGLPGQETTPVEPVLSVPTAIGRWLSADFRHLDDRRIRLAKELASLPATPQNEQSAHLGWKIFGYSGALPPRQWVEVDLGGIYPIDAVALVPVDEPTPETGGPGYGFPRRFRVELRADSSPAATLADFSAVDFPNPGALPVLLPARQAKARYVRVTMIEPWTSEALEAYALGEIMVLSGNRNLATGLRGVKVRASGSLESPPAWSREHLTDGQSTVGAPLVRGERRRAHGWQSARSGDGGTAIRAQVDLGRAWPLDELRLVPARLQQYTTRQAYGFPSRLRVEVSSDAEFASPRVLAEWSSQPFINPAFNPVVVPGDGQPARHLRITALELWPRGQDYHLFALAEVQAYSGGVNVARNATVSVSSSQGGEPSHWQPAFLTDGLRGSLELIEWPEWLHLLSRRREVLHELAQTGAALAARQPALARTTRWMLMIGLTLGVLGTLTAIARARLAQTRAVIALQRRIAGDLHDEIGSNLANIAMLTELGQRAPGGIASADVTEIRRLAHESAAAMRDIVWLIQPGPHDAPRLAERLRASAGRLLGGLEWQFKITGLAVAPALDVQRHLLLALKEILHNVLRHANAGRVEIRLAAEGPRFSLEVRDNGQGFDPRLAVDGHGLTSLRHRATLLGGALELDSRPGHGTRVVLSGNLHPAAPPASLSA